MNKESDGFSLASWIQWLRHTRYEAPTINEQQLDEIRQTKIKQLAAQADARWASKPSYLDAPSKPVRFTPISIDDTSPTDKLNEADIKDAGNEHIPHAHLGQKPLIKVEGQDRIRDKRERKEVRWEDLTLGKSDGGPQPQPWTPRPVNRR